MTDFYETPAPEDQVRLLIADVDPTKQLLTDQQLITFLQLNSNNVRRAAAEALDTIAVSEILVSKVIRTQDLQTNGAAVSAELRARATQLRATADQADAATDPVFNVFPMDGPRPCPPELTATPVVWGL